MAVTLDATLGTGNSTGGAATTSLVTAATVAAGGFIVLLCGRFGGVPTATQSVTAAGGLTWTADHNVTSGSIRIYVWSAPAPAGLASGTTITITHSSVVGGLDCIMGAASYLGVDTAGSPVTAFNGVGASTAAWSSGSVAGNAGDALIGGCFVDAGAVSSSTPTSPAVERIDVNVPAQAETLTLADKLSLAGADTLDGTWNAAGGHVAAAVAYRAAAGAAAIPPILLMAQPAAGGI